MASRKSKRSPSRNRAKTINRLSSNTKDQSNQQAQQQHKQDQNNQRAQQQHKQDQSNQQAQQQHKQDQSNQQAQQQQKQDQNNQRQQHVQQQQDQNREQAQLQRSHQQEVAQQSEQRGDWRQHRARDWDSEHRDWQQRGGYKGYRIPDTYFNSYYGQDHSFRVYSLPFRYVGGYPRFQYGGYWFSAVDPYPEYWGDDWYETDDVYVAYYDNGYYLYDRNYPGRPGVAISISF